MAVHSKNYGVRLSAPHEIVNFFRYLPYQSHGLDFKRPEVQLYFTILQRQLARLIFKHICLYHSLEG